MHYDRARIGLITLSLNSCGGSQRLTLVLAQTLREKGYRVELIVTERSDWRRIRQILSMGKESLDKEILIPPFVRLPTIYSTFFYWLFRDLLFAHLKRRYDLTINTMVTLPLVYSDVLYIHFPDFVPQYLDRYYDKYSRGALRAYSLAFRLFSNLSVKAFKALQRKPLVVANSKYTQEEIRNSMGMVAQVVYPPVETHGYLRFNSNRHRKNIVLTVSRVEESKRLHIIPELARRVKDAEFMIVGTSKGAQSSRYISGILREATKLGVRNRVSIITNVRDQKKLELLSRAKVYLHTMKFEHFGMSIVEAMSAGLVPVVPKSGGPWLDILNRSQGSCGYGYDNLDEAAGIIAQLLDNDDIRTEISKRAIERAMYFDTAHFKDSMLGIVEQLLERKQRHERPAPMTSSDA